MRNIRRPREDGGRNGGWANLPGAPAFAGATAI